MCSCSWLHQILPLLKQKEKLFYHWAFCLFPSLLVLARLCPVKYLTEGLVGIAFTLPTLDCFSFLHLFWTRYWISKKVRRNAQSIWKNLILDIHEKNTIFCQKLFCISFSFRETCRNKWEMVFCYQKCSDLLWEKNCSSDWSFWNSRLKAKNCKILEITRTIFQTVKGQKSFW